MAYYYISYHGHKNHIIHYTMTYSTMNVSVFGYDDTFDACAVTIFCCVIFVQAVKASDIFIVKSPSKRFIASFPTAAVAVYYEENNENVLRWQTVFKTVQFV